MPKISEKTTPNAVSYTHLDVYKRQTITFALNKETREQVLSGLGEQHLDVIVSKLKNKFGVDVTLELPKVAYRETSRKPVEAQGKHKKQSGGHGQFGDVWKMCIRDRYEALLYGKKRAVQKRPVLTQAHKERGYGSR